MSLPISPLAPDTFPTLPAVSGVRLAAGSAGIRKSDRDDLLVVSVAKGSTVAGMMTQTLCPAAPIDWCRDVLSGGDGTADALVCNSGNANAFTGKAGAVSAGLMAEAVAKALGTQADRVLVSSTGIIGEPMPDEKLTSAIPDVATQLVESGPASWERAANAIRTTDTFAKGATAPISGTNASIVGIAKGSGMIAPDMATMLGFFFTDLGVDSSILQKALATSVTKSFNSITVDSDTSTNDSVFLYATGQSDDPMVTDPSDERMAHFQEPLAAVTLDLAKRIVRDGEGATKLVSVTVTGAVSESSASKIARSIADSPLVKTALAAEDANWGRIVMAVGKAGEPADRDKLSIWIGPELVAQSGTVAEGYSEETATQHLMLDEISLQVDVGVGEHQATVWTCDLTHGYIEINAGYRS